jgi:hypothetical protein
MKTAFALPLVLFASFAAAQQQLAEFPAAATAFIEQERPKMEAAISNNDFSYFAGAHSRLQTFFDFWGLNSSSHAVLDAYPVCANAVTDFIISGMCRISPPGSICEPSTFLPRVEVAIAQCSEQARANPAVQGTLRDKAAQRP